MNAKGDSGRRDRRLVLLLPCPFCGCKPTIRGSREGTWTVECVAVRCQINPRTFPFDLKHGDVTTKAHAVECWNRRPNSNRIFWQNVKEHATLSAGASVDHGVEVESTEEHVNRAADRGCCVSSCSACLLFVWNEVHDEGKSLYLNVVH